MKIETRIFWNTTEKCNRLNYEKYSKIPLMRPVRLFLNHRTFVNLKEPLSKIKKKQVSQFRLFHHYGHKVYLNRGILLYFKG